MDDQTFPLFQRLASLVQARKNAEDSKNAEWVDKHTWAIDALENEHFPSGSGFDNGASLDLAVSTHNKLVISTSFHHMNENGYYDGWTYHDVIVRPSLVFGFDLRITGRDRDGIKDYIAEVFHHALHVQVPRYPRK